MAEIKEGIAFEDLMTYAQESQQAGLRYKVPGDQHIMHLLASIAREAEARFGEKGLQMVEQAVEKFGEDRGRRIAKLVKQDGKPLTLMNFFLYGDLDISGNEMVPELVDGALHVRVSKCRLFDKLHELGLQKYGILYCRPVDNAVLRGYNPRLHLEVKTRISGGADCCLFIYHQPNGAVE